VQLIIFGGCLTVFKTKIHGCSTKRAGRFGYRVRSAVMIYMQPAQTQLPLEQRIDGTWLTPALAPEKKIPVSTCEVNIRYVAAHRKLECNSCSSRPQISIHFILPYLTRF